MTGQAMLDFNRSFLNFTTLDRGNTARIQIEARCTLTEHSGGASHRYVMIASCKAEDTYGSGALFKQPNYDFSGVFSDSEYAIYRVFAEAQDNQGESGRLEQLFAGVDIVETLLDAPRMLESAAEIIRATIDGLPLCARTTFDALDGRYSARLDYPIKTINVHPGRERFQVDTGPLPYPDVAAATGRVVDVFVPAFVAYQELDQAEFIVQEATRLAGGASVIHYAGTRAITARTVIYAAQ